MRKIWLLLAVILVPVAYASDFMVLVEPVKDSIFTDQRAEFKIHVTNYQKVEDTITVRYEGFIWNLHSEPLYHYFSGIKINPNSTVESTIYFNPTSQIGIGRYVLGLDFTSKNTGLKITKPLTVNVKPLFQEEIEYKASVDITTEIPDFIDPRNEITIKLNLKNRNPLDIKSLSIDIQSNLINDFRDTSLAPLMEKTEEFHFKLDDLQAPAEDELTITVKKDDEVLRVIKKKYNVVSYTNLIKDYEEQQYFFKKVRIITIRNVGNIVNQDTVKIPKSDFAGLFEKTDPESQVVKEIDGDYNEWEVILDPMEETRVQVTINYRSILVVVALIILLIAGYFIFRSEIVATKVGTTISMKEGGTSEIKVLIYLKNRSRSFMQSLNIVDRVPHLAEISTEHTMGTLAPSKILKHERKGTLMKWDIETIESQEERILSYKIITKLSILGKFSLPPTIIKYKDRKGNEKLVSSNSAKV